MAERSLRQEGLPVDYYAPDYKIEIEGRTLDAETKGDVLRGGSDDGSGRTSPDSI